MVAVEKNEKLRCLRKGDDHDSLVEREGKRKTFPRNTQKKVWPKSLVQWTCSAPGGVHILRAWLQEFRYDPLLGIGEVGSPSWVVVGTAGWAEAAPSGTGRPWRL